MCAVKHLVFSYAIKWITCDDQASDRTIRRIKIWSRRAAASRVQTVSIWGLDGATKSLTATVTPTPTPAASPTRDSRGAGAVAALASSLRLHLIFDEEPQGSCDYPEFTLPTNYGRALSGPFRIRVCRCQIRRGFVGFLEGQ